MRAVLVAALYLAPSFTCAQDSMLARSLVATCAQCHGTEGRSVANEIPPIAGMSRDLIVARMREFRSGRRPATVMQHVAKGYDDEQIELIAAYLARRR